MSTMKRVEIKGLGVVASGTGSVPEPESGWARVKIELAGICGSDTHAVAGHHPLLIPPYLPGHEMIGWVDALGDDVTGVEVGQRVLVQPNVGCGECVNCRAGRVNACQTLQWIGCDSSGKLPGGMAEYVAAPARMLFPISDEIAADDAVLIECLSTPVHAARIAGDLTGAKVVVVGAGTIGLLSVLAAKHAGAGTIVVLDLEESKRERALRYGADYAVDAAGDSVAAVAELLDGPADVVFDCVTIEATLRQSLQMLRRAGTLLVVGVPPRDASLPLPYIQDWELRVQGCANYTVEDILTAIEIANQGGLPGSEIVTAHYAIDDATEAFEVAAKGTSGKVVIDPQL